MFLLNDLACLFTDTYITPQWLYIQLGLSVRGVVLGCRSIADIPQVWPLTNIDIYITRITGHNETTVKQCKKTCNNSIGHFASKHNILSNCIYLKACFYCSTNVESHFTHSGVAIGISYENHVTGLLIPWPRVDRASFVVDYAWQTYFIHNKKLLQQNVSFVLQEMVKNDNSLSIKQIQHARAS